MNRGERPTTSGHIRARSRRRCSYPSEMARIIESQFEFVASYEVEQLERIDRSEGVRVLGFPNATPLDPQQEMADRPIIRVRPAVGHPWVGVFNGGSYASPSIANGRLIGWPDRRSVCVVYAGCGVVVPSDAPDAAFEIDSFPITGVLVAPEHEMVFFSDFTSFAAYDANGLRWRSEVASDDATLTEVEDGVVAGYGFLNGVDRHPIRLDITTGRTLNSSRSGCIAEHSPKPARAYGAGSCSRRNWS
jgi:hypothetical protein